MTEKTSEFPIRPGVPDRIPAAPAAETVVENVPVPVLVIASHPIPSHICGMVDLTGEYVIAWITAATADEAAMIARVLVEERLAACCGVLPGVRSIYRWQNAVQEDVEAVVMCKTRQSEFDRLAARTRELHSYELPEIICTAITDGSVPYLQWIDESLSRAR